MSRKGYIYGLIDPSTGQLRYIGQTVRKIEYRLTSHLGSAKTLNKFGELKYNSYVYRWIRQVLAQNQEPQIVLIQEFQEEDVLDDAETFWIAYFRKMGCPLTNLASGGRVGCRGRKASDESKKRMSIAQRSLNKKLSEELKMRLSLANRGKKASEEAKKKMSEAHKGRIVSDETRVKMSLSFKGRKISEEHRRQLSLLNKGRPRHTEVSKAKISAANKGKVYSEEECIARSKRLGGRPFKDQYGNIYKTVNSAGRKLGFAASNISAVLKGKRKSTKGYEFQYLENNNNDKS